MGKLIGVCLLLLILLAYQNNPSPQTAEGKNILMAGFQYRFENSDLQLDFEQREGHQIQASIILVPVLAILFLGVYYLFQLIRRKQLVETYAALFENLSSQSWLDTLLMFRKTEKEERNIPRLFRGKVGSPTNQLELKAFRSKHNSPNKLHTNQKFLADLRGSIQDIHDAQTLETLERDGLKSAILGLFSSINASNKIHIEEIIVGLNDKSAWDQDLNLNFYRIIEEILHTLIDHSTASQVKVQIIEQKNLVTIYIEDNGKGLKNIENKEELALKFLKSNQALKCNMEVCRTQDQKNLVLIELPLPLSIK